MSVTGSFVYQTDLVPGSGTGFQNIFFDNFTDAATIPDADDFTINFGPFTWTKADNLDAERLAGIQYNNGAFNGFVFLTNFTFQGQDYRFNLEGSVISVRLLSGGFPTGSSYINGTLNSPAFGGTAYTPPVTPPTPGVPEPATWAMMIAGMGLAGAAMRARKSAVAFA
ncbi:PEPxxWA-CTERM sorting domain-containing protein [Sphingobium sp. H33]|uniref:PEPxxWA-CTERM sorting domain-containing protein n=2 Tax=Sphingobium nicotianae TaxID=2782607 RepID=A0A9X1DCL4_9SPHN|nr:PEPxxWA-CTERM sorting domain-containing protein [Sphingobium nicotianae]